MPSPVLKETDYYYNRLLSEDYLKSREERARFISIVLSENIDVSAIKSVVEIGSGSGILKKHLSEYLNVRIIGTEIDREVIVDSVDTLMTDGANIPLKNSCADLVICNNVIEHASNRNALFNEMCRIMNPNGVLYFTSPLKFTPWETHYRLPFLSWLPQTLANRYLQVTRRVAEYTISYPTYAELLSTFHNHNLSFQDITTPILFEDKYPIKRQYVAFRNFFKHFPETIITNLLKQFSPEQFFLLRKKGERD